VIYYATIALLQPLQLGRPYVLYGFPPDGESISCEQLHDTFHPDERAELEVKIAQSIDPDGIGWFIDDRRVVLPSGEIRCLSIRKQVFCARSAAVARPKYAILVSLPFDRLFLNKKQLDRVMLIALN
jgi:hypothetical protein